MSGGAALEEYLSRPLAPADPVARAALEAGPIDPSEALRREQIDRLRDPAPLTAENGWCTLPDGVGFVAVRTPMPAVTGEMVDWWFDWHPRDPLRYRVWHPLAHFSNSVELPRERGSKAHWGAVHHPVEDVGTGRVQARISFVAPVDLGFADDALGDPHVATIVCGWVGDDKRRVRHSVMAHVFLVEGDGVVLRSHFWLGAAIRPYAPEPIAGVAERLLNHPAVRRTALPAGLPQALARHCAEEYANLAAILPELHRTYA